MTISESIDGGSIAASNMAPFGDQFRRDRRRREDRPEIG